MKRAVIVTPYHMSPPHPRIVMQREILESEGFNVEIVHPAGRNLRSKIAMIFRLKLESASICLVYDLFPLALLCLMRKPASVPLVYDVIDNFPHYYAHTLQRKFPILRSCYHFFIHIFECLEKNIVTSACRMVVVNSSELQIKFSRILDKSRVSLLYYSSPFEDLKSCFCATKKPALVYLGVFNLDKGADTALQVFQSCREHLPDLKFYIFGDIHFQIPDDKNIVVFKKLSQEALRDQLASILKDYYLVGLSLIKGIHYSYATQEANKDIDYLSMGIPILGNDRRPTQEKIDAGCGVTIASIEDIMQLLIDEKFYSSASKKSKEYYDKLYSRKLFARRFVSAVRLSTE